MDKWEVLSTLFSSHQHKFDKEIEKIRESDEILVWFGRTSASLKCRKEESLLDVRKGGWVAGWFLERNAEYPLEAARKAARLGRDEETG